MPEQSVAEWAGFADERDLLSGRNSGWQTAAVFFGTWSKNIDPYDLWRSFSRLAVY
jgi:hypothetical protein